jgi:hypothetical protein
MSNEYVLATSPLRLTTSNFIFQLNGCCYSPYITSSLTRGWVCHLQLLLVLASAVILRSESRGTHDHSLPSQIRDSTNLEGQVPVFISPRNSVARLYPQAPDSLFVASYDSQDYDGSIRARLHTGSHVGRWNWLLMYPRRGPHRKHRLQQFLQCCVHTLLSDGSGIVASVLSLCLAVAVFGRWWRTNLIFQTPIFDPNLRHWSKNKNNKRTCQCNDSQSTRNVVHVGYTWDNGQDQT